MFSTKQSIHSIFAEDIAPYKPLRINKQKLAADILVSSSCRVLCDDLLQHHAAI
jgi:hypothetical protein